ncbi:ABC transporter ATP-binding protein [Streptomyces antibioticus]|uniref:ABC transporter ATP-binding protein n=1 Tax=Streptomyces antibioticus TaxID=1890 RepID=UPI00225AF80F|nr:ABC transporter ATP-binding protein [Streptomyces antibioticus]MCX5171976.1 ABC transporter ATP-binding protein [Streptomyces antibioticus]
MIQAVGLTSNPRKALPPAVDDVSFEARAGRVTVLLGASGAGKTTVLRLMLELQQGRGLTYFRGRPLHRIAHPSREVGVLLGDVPGHPSRTVRGHLRMLCAATGVPVRRADEVLEVVGLVSLRDERLGTLSRGMDRRLGLACALLADPHTLVLDAPADGLSSRENRWLHGMLRAHADQGGTVLTTTTDPKEAARTADQVVTLKEGRLVADQDAADFARTRLRPRVAVRSPHAARLAALLTKEARTAHCSVEVVQEDGNRLSVYGSTCAHVGEAAFRHGILIHQLADETGDMGSDAVVMAAVGVVGAGARVEASATADCTESDTDTDTDDPFDNLAEAEAEAEAETVEVGSEAEVERPDTTPPPAPAQSPPLPSPRAADALSALPPPISVRSAPSPLRPLRYELRRAAGISTGFLTGAAVLVVSALTAVLLARVGHTPQARLLAAWPAQLPLPPAALGAGLLGALAFGDEFRHPALAADRGTVPRRLGMLTAKLVVAAFTALLLAFLTMGCNAEVLYLLYGREFAKVPGDWLALTASWFGLVVGCAWAGVLAAGVFRSTTAGLAAVLAVPVAVVPLVQAAAGNTSVRTAAGLSVRLREVLLVQWPFGGERYLSAAVRLVAQPVGWALALSLTTLLCAYLFTTLRSRVR